MVVDDPKPASPSLAPSWVRPAQFAKAARSRHHVPELRILRQKVLQADVFFIRHVVAQITRKGRRLEEFHVLIYTLIAYLQRVCHRQYVCQTLHLIGRLAYVCAPRKALRNLFNPQYLTQN
jgi:uncharacterized membrane protein